MEAGLVGLPNVGKSMLFNALTKAGASSENFPFCTIEANVGVVEVPDLRLDIIQEYITTQKVIPAALKLVDIAGLVRGASKGEGMGNQFLGDIRQVDAIVQVVRCFDDDNVIHVDGGVDPLRDIETIDLELIAADAQVIENSLSKAKRNARTGAADAKARVSTLEKIEAVLADLKPVRSTEYSEDEQKILKTVGLITAKPVLYVANVAEDDLEGQSEHVQKVKEHAAEHGGEVVVVCAKLEAELQELDGDDFAEMLESMGLEHPALFNVAQSIYTLLGLQSYFTAGEKEVRAWTIPIGATAPQAAGVIHTDFERGFIRAEVYHLDDLKEHKTEVAIRGAGKLRAEGKSYVMQDGDIVHFLFNV